MKISLFRKVSSHAPDNGRWLNNPVSEYLHCPLKIAKQKTNRIVPYISLCKIFKKSQNVKVFVCLVDKDKTWF